MGSASETARGSHLHPKPVAGNRLHGRPEEDLPAVLRQVVQPRGRDVLPAARGHPPRPPDQRAYHLRQWHEGQVHQAYPEEGLQVREQVRQAAGEGCQVCLCQPTEAVQGLSPPSSVTMTDSILQGRWRLIISRPLLDDFIQFCHCHVLLVSLLLLPSFST